MTGLLGLVPLAELLASAAGSRHGATTLAVHILSDGGDAIGANHDDIHVAVRYQLVATGVTTDAGVVITARAAELIAVCDILAASTVPSPAPPPEPRLVLSAPDGAVPIHDRERLEGLVLDVIRLARTTLHIGGAFWNDAGFGILEDVLTPALQGRNVTATVYVNGPDAEHRESLRRRLENLRSAGPATVLWFTGPRPRMLHAKFVIADCAYGYLGTANLTSWGMRHHIEAGVELTPGQSARFVRFLGQLDEAGFFTETEPGVS